MKNALLSPAASTSADGPNATWLCSNRRHARVSPRTARYVRQLGSLGNVMLLQRLDCQVWIRYRIDLAPYTACSVTTPAELTPMTAAFIESLSRRPWRDIPQARTAIKFWRHGLRSGYVWIRDGKPLCLQWLFSHHDNPLLQNLPDWSGMYPPLAQDCGQVESLLTLPPGMRYPGGAAGPFALAMYRLAAKKGKRWLITNIHERNAAAHRWAQRTGWTAYGHVYRYQPDLPLLRGRWHAYVHNTIVPQADFPVLPQVAGSSK